MKRWAIKAKIEIAREAVTGVLDEFQNLFKWALFYGNAKDDKCMILNR